MINSGKEWAWMDNNKKLKNSMNVSDIKSEMKWVEQVLTHKDNNNLHYPALKQLINNFYNKWVNKNNTTIMNIYSHYLKSILRSEFGR